MPLDLEDTIAALASPPGPAKRGIIRISGADTLSVLQTVAPDANCSDLELATRVETSLVAPRIGVPVPANVLVWPNARSYTGQPSAEIHLIGSPPLLDAVLEGIFQAGGRPAERGEFTMRAFLAGRIDLVQAEGVLGVIDATDHDELESALNQLGGGITQLLISIRQRLISVLGDLEAGLDFVEEDIEFVSRTEISIRLSEVLEQLNILESSTQSRLPSGYRPRVVLAGLPNAGKSTLFNRLVGQQQAIVSDVAGTTRDYLTATVTFDGVETELVDTAGWETASDIIMQRAEEFRANQMEASDLLVWCTAGDLSPEMSVLNKEHHNAADSSGCQILQVMTRCDVVQDEVPQNLLSVSGATGQGVDLLVARISDCLNKNQSSRAQLLFTTVSRCRDSLKQAIESVQAAQGAIADGCGDEVLAIELRTTLHELATISGEVYTDDILDHIFSSFCIGK